MARQVEIFNGDSVSDSEKRKLENVADGRPFIATKDVGYGRDEINYENGLKVPFADISYKTTRANSVLICAEGGSAGRKIGLTNREVCFGNKLFANETWDGIDPRYIFYVYQSPSFYSEFTSRKTGIIGGIAKSEFSLIPILIPPLSEQCRIVAKIDELMAMCDRIEAARAAREALRDRLAAASLARLTAPGSETIRDDSRFALDTLPALTARPDQIKQFRQAILNLAVRGKLVPQDDGRRLQTGLGPTEDVTKYPFVIPGGWQWTELGKIAGFENGDRGKNYPKSFRVHRKGDSLDQYRSHNAQWFAIYRVNELYLQS